ncbi:hypothetical protein FI667_g5348, partial [Globisporangium splendens]
MLKFFFVATLFTSASTSSVVNAFAPCAEGESEISVEGTNGVFCVKGSTICAAEISEGACSSIQDGLPFGSYCGRVFSGVYGCKTLDAESVKTFQPWVDPATTPAPTAATTPAPTTVAAPTPAPDTSCSGGSPMSVEGVNGVSCVVGSPVCASDVSNGACPDVQRGLPFGSYCGKVASGVYGCEVLDADSIKTYQPAVTTQPSASTTAPQPTPVPASPTSTSLTPSPVITPAPSTSTTSAPVSDGSCAGGIPMSVEGVVGIFCVSGSPVCASDTFQPTSPSVTPSSTATTTSSGPSSTPAPTTATTTVTPIVATSSSDCSNGGSPMSVEGVQKVFYVTGIACAGSIADGSCPGAQDGLAFGSFCDLVRTGVYGCRPYTAVNQKPAFTVLPSVSCSGNPAGSTLNLSALPTVSATALAFKAD